MLVFLSVTEAAARLGLTRDGLIRRLRAYPLEADAMIGTTRGWLPDTLDAWDKTIPGPGPAPRSKSPS
ncbi:helix-turn-helix domain-containing protein [Kocuria marina]|uniref:helix-turn-helix domain-containing protein n=1 Tax=Kocuria marina TaxID=223184 RepID=UPI0022E4E471|nr:helix-turn-helix domain-containing protein [Kocuria marina]